jgi:thiosulfate reductase cytochrome b subunit
LLSFIITHLYLITTGEKVTTNLKAMLTGYEELDEHNDEEKKSSSEKSE